MSTAEQAFNYRERMREDEPEKYDAMLRANRLRAKRKRIADHRAKRLALAGDPAALAAYLKSYSKRLRQWRKRKLNKAMGWRRV